MQLRILVGRNEVQFREGEVWGGIVVDEATSPVRFRTCAQAIPSEWPIPVCTGTGRYLFSVSSGQQSVWNQPPGHSVIRRKRTLDQRIEHHEMPPLVQANGR